MIAKANPATGAADIHSGQRTVMVEADDTIPVGRIDLYDDHGIYIKSVYLGGDNSGGAGERNARHRSKR